MNETYTLPSSPDLLCEDRLSVLDSEELEVPFWRALETILGANVTTAGALVELLEIVAVTRSGKTNTDYGFLRDFMVQHLSSDFYKHTWPLLTKLALEMPVLFPSHSLPICTPQHPSLVLSRRQTACLVVHQFLCTLAAPSWQDGYQDFHIWYSAYQPHEKAVTAYLTALFTYFERLAAKDGFSPLDYDRDQWLIRYTLRTEDAVDLTSPCSLADCSTVEVPEATTSPEVLGLEGGAAVISANKFIGFGQTGTQEETHVGASPECCPVVLVTPPLRENQAQVVQGPEAMISIAGYGRDARCSHVLARGSSPREHCGMWSLRTMIFVDALELDVASHDRGLPDLLPGNVEREIKKAIIGFKTASQPLRTVFTGYWGCRTFGGNPYVKFIVQWCAASMAGSGKICFVLSNPEQHIFGTEFIQFTQAARSASENRADRLIASLLRLRPGVVGQESIFSRVLQDLGAPGG